MDPALALAGANIGVSLVQEGTKYGFSAAITDASSFHFILLMLFKPERRIPGGHDEK